jgi:Transposase and inactivated derivatives
MSKKSNAQLQQENEELRREVVLLRQKIDLLVRRIFGRGSETLSPDQLELLLGGEPEGAPSKADASWMAQEADPQHEATRRKGRRSAKERWPEDLPVIEEVLDPEEVKAAPQEWRRIGAEVSESLDYEPARFLRRRLVRNKYVPRHGLDVVPVIAPLPAMLQERCMAAPGLLAAIVVGKYCDHLPLYRQEAIFASRHGITLPRQSQARWIELAADWLRPIYDAIGEEIRSGGYVQIDETPIRYLSPGNGQTKLGYLWTTCRPRGDVIYHWETSRSARCLDNVIPVNFTGTIQCDAYAAYPGFARKRGLALAGCWAHARRAFYEAREHAPQAAGFILGQIAHLYRIEARLRKTHASPKLRAIVRGSESAPILTRIRRALLRWKTSRRFLPKSTLGKAIDYTLSNWSLLEVYVHDGHIEIDNNSVENSIRPTAIGKKNWLFIGAADAGQRSAILFTIIESCRRRSINPFDYLRDVLTRLPSMTNWQIKDITPSAWATARRPTPLKRAA